MNIRPKVLNMTFQSRHIDPQECMETMARLVMFNRAVPMAKVKRLGLFADVRPTRP
jgi:hypothetical protein